MSDNGSHEIISVQNPTQLKIRLKLGCASGQNWKWSKGFFRYTTRWATYIFFGRIHEKCKWVNESYSEKTLGLFQFCPNAHPNLSLIFGYVGFWTEIISCEPLSDILSEKSDIIQDALGGYCTDDRALKIVRFSIWTLNRQFSGLTHFKAQWKWGG